jgi:hypothetical protein
MLWTASGIAVGTCWLLTSASLGHDDATASGGDHNVANHEQEQWRERQQWPYQNPRAQPPQEQYREQP